MAGSVATGMGNKRSGGLGEQTRRCLPCIMPVRQVTVPFWKMVEQWQAEHCAWVPSTSRVGGPAPLVVFQCCDFGVSGGRRRGGDTARHSTPDHPGHAWLGAHRPTADVGAPRCPRLRYSRGCIWLEGSHRCLYTQALPSPSQPGGRAPPHLAATLCPFELVGLHTDWAILWCSMVWAFQKKKKKNGRPRPASPPPEPVSMNTPRLVHSHDAW